MEKEGIEILNKIQDGDEVSYPLVRIIGKINSPQLVLDNIFSVSDQVTVCKIDEDEVRHEEEESWPVFKGYFKCLILLSPGKNYVTVSYKRLSLSLSFHLVYHPLSYFSAPSLPTREPFTVRMIYIVASDDPNPCFQLPSSLSSSSSSSCSNSLSDAIIRLQFAALQMQTFCSESMFYHSLPRKSFLLLPASPSSPLPHITVFRSSLTTSQIHSLGSSWKSDQKAYGFFQSELSSTLPHSSSTINCVILSVTKFTPGPPKSLVAHTALGGGKLGLFGSSTLFAWPHSLSSFKSCSFNNTSTSIDIHNDCGGKCRETGGGERSWKPWAYFSTGIGATMHEVGHCFGLHHTAQGIMSRGFDSWNRFWAIYEPGYANQCWKEGKNFMKDLEECQIGQGEVDKCGEGGAFWSRPSALFLDYSPYFYQVYKSRDENDTELRRLERSEDWGEGVEVIEDSGKGYTIVRSKFEAKNLEEYMKADDKPNDKEENEEKEKKEKKKEGRSWRSEDRNFVIREGEGGRWIEEGEGEEESEEEWRIIEEDEELKETRKALELSLGGDNFEQETEEKEQDSHEEKQNEEELILVNKPGTKWMKIQMNKVYLSVGNNYEWKIKYLGYWITEEPKESNNIEGSKCQQNIHWKKIGSDGSFEHFKPLDANEAEQVNEKVMWIELPQNLMFEQVKYVEEDAGTFKKVILWDRSRDMYLKLTNKYCFWGGGKAGIEEKEIKWNLIYDGEWKEGSGEGGNGNLLGIEVGNKVGARGQIVFVEASSDQGTVFWWQDYSTKHPGFIDYLEIDTELLRGELWDKFGMTGETCKKPGVRFVDKDGNATFVKCSPKNMKKEGVEEEQMISDEKIDESFSFFNE